MREYAPMTTIFAVDILFLLQPKHLQPIHLSFLSPIHLSFLSPIYLHKDYPVVIFTHPGAVVKGIGKADFYEADKIEVTFDIGGKLAHT